MAIEFNCAACGQLITAPDDTVGRSARCPKCLGGVTIPDIPPVGTLPQAALASGSQPTPVGSPGDFPFPGVSTTQSRGAPAATDRASQPENPYVSPATVETAVADSPDVRTEIRHRQMKLGQLLGHTWAVFTEQFVMCFVVGFTLTGFVLGVGVAVFALSEIVFGVSRMDELMPFVPVLIPLGLTGFTVYCWLLLGQAILMIKLCRGERAGLGDLFAGGPYLWRGLGLMFIVCMIECVVSLVFLVPAATIMKPVAEVVCQFLSNVAKYVISLILFLSVYFIVDRDEGVFRSLGSSARYMTGNKLVVFASHLVFCVVGIPFLVVTCSVGTLILMPYYMLLSAMVYVLATGQPTAADRQKALRKRIRR
jgi:hypothetical protein